MRATWYVTFEVDKRGMLPKRRSPRGTETFATEAEAKRFARSKFDEGLIVFAGTLNPTHRESSLTRTVFSIGSLKKRRPKYLRMIASETTWCDVLGRRPPDK
jgi:hypothetical protein